MNDKIPNCAALSDLRIEAVRPEEIDRLLAIERDSFTVPWTRKMFEAEITGNPFSRLDVARVSEEGRLIGFVCYWVVFDELHLLDVAVDPVFRRLGAGRRLVAHALAQGAAVGARRALLEVRASNQAAQGLYERFGFRTVGTRPKYYTNPVEDARLLELQPVSSSAGTVSGDVGEKGRVKSGVVLPIHHA
jgi:ribosomal-protein-alanine N-acetyltransferase